MFWIFASLAGLFFSAVTLGKYMVMFALLKIALLVALLIITFLAITMMYRSLRGRR